MAASDRPSNIVDSNEREQRYNEFVALLTRHDLSIRRFVRSLLPSRDGVEDVVQETALECWRKFDDFATQNSGQADEFARWACVIARYKTLSWQRDQGRDRLVFRDSVMEVLAASALPQLDRLEEERRAMEGCLAKLGESQRQLVLSVHSPGQSVSSIAKQTGQKARRLYYQLNVLRASLQQCVEKQLQQGLRHG
ncbi:sigma-70 family RNA polymerase sigma factor [Rhodopirellula sp. P2]|uniref:sigma-70 family RNA polymerase sigma factor n=1 Tax=Rhodopirellula sp. P2 TaxID=2127060 RepID=UPI002367F43F|nr:sigma-70 family RNA polymerase sigma factor [Rhodopirellula sp. P2]WDQ14596.1 sigma-70 family RNA polymerase sigma factor [Rhodopirellula sp. P2]